MNTKNPVHDAQGRPLFQIGGSGAFNSHDCGQYQVSMEWDETEPMMVIWSKRTGFDFAHGICLSSIGKYALPSGDLAPEGAVELAKLLPVFGFDLNATELKKLADVVLRYTPELIAMPPKPRSLALEDAGGPLLEITTVDRNTGKTIREISL